MLIEVTEEEHALIVLALNERRVDLMEQSYQYALTDADFGLSAEALDYAKKAEKLKLRLEGVPT